MSPASGGVGRLLTPTLATGAAIVTAVIGLGWVAVPLFVLALVAFI
jgi:hypothetical protein